MDKQYLKDLISEVAYIDDKLEYGWFDMIIEEVGELLSTAQKFERGRDDFNHVREETADVIVTILVMLWRMGGFWEIENVGKIACQKLERTVKRNRSLLD